MWFAPDRTFFFFRYHTICAIQFYNGAMSWTSPVLIAVCILSHLNQPYIYRTQSIFKLHTALGIVPVHLLTLCLLLPVSQCGTVRLSVILQLFSNVLSLSLSLKAWPPWPFFLLRHDYIPVHQMLSISRPLCTEWATAWTRISCLHCINNIRTTRNSVNKSSAIQISLDKVLSGQWKFLKTRNRVVHSVIFSKCVILVRVRVDPEPFPGIPGMSQEYSMNGVGIHHGTPLNHRATCTHAFTPRGHLV